jgi:hypothetical protein
VYCIRYHTVIQNLQLLCGRLIAGTLCQYYYTFGYILMAFIAYFLNFNWQLLQVT